MEPPLRDTWLAYQEGLDLDAIASRRGLPLTQAADHLLRLIELGQPVLAERVIAVKKYQLIDAALARLGESAAWEHLRGALPAFVADHEIFLVRAGR
ncbi:MAG: helix-turn-helix domain-containing protein [Pseudomonadota bacterium]